MGGGDLRERLLAEARAHLDERGIAGLTLRGIARRAGVSHGAPLRHFDGVDHLLAAVAARGFRELHELVAAARDEAGDGASAIDRLAAAARGYVRFALANPGVYELMFRHERHAADDPELADAGARAFLLLVSTVASAQADGWWPDEPPGQLSAVLWASVHGVVSLWLPGTLAAGVSVTGEPADLDDVVDLLVRMTTSSAPISRRITTSKGDQP